MTVPACTSLTFSVELHGEAGAELYSRLCTQSITLTYHRSDTTEVRPWLSFVKTKTAAAAVLLSVPESLNHYGIDLAASIVIYQCCNPQEAKRVSYLLSLSNEVSYLPFCRCALDGPGREGCRGIGSDRGERGDPIKCGGSTKGG